VKSTDPPYTIIRRHWVDLRAAAVAGTAHPRTTSIARWIPPAVLADRDRLARMERGERVAVAPGERPCPADLDAVQAAIDVTAAVLLVDDTVREHLGLTLWLRDETHPMTVPGACADIEVLVRLLDDDMADWVVDELRTAAAALLRALDMGDDPLVLAAPCPSCGGALVLTPDDRVGPYVVCLNTTPCHALTNAWHHGRPIWREAEMPLLGDLLNAAASAA